MSPKSDQRSRRNFIVTSTSAATAAAVSSVLVACGGSSAPAAEFKYGVASGDPLADRVMLWTHAKVADSAAVVGLTWQVATKSPTYTAAIGKTISVAATGAVTYA